MSAFGIGPTELRILLAVGTLALYTMHAAPVVAGHVVRLFDLGGLVGQRP